MQAMTVFCYNNEFRAVNCRGYCSSALFCYARTRHPIEVVVEWYGVDIFHRHKGDFCTPNRNGLILGVFNLEWTMFIFRCVCSCAIFLMAAIYFKMKLRLFIWCILLDYMVLYYKIRLCQFWMVSPIF